MANDDAARGRTRRALLRSGGVLAAAGLLAGCTGGDGGDPSSPDEPTTSETATGTTSPPPGPRGIREAAPPGLLPGADPNFRPAKKSNSLWCSATRFAAALGDACRDCQRAVRAHLVRRA